MSKEIRVLVVDDSAVMRKIIRDILESDPEIIVVETARNGIDALEKVAKHQPDVVTMDIEMPKMDGLAALQYIMAEDPRPVIMLSAMNKRHADIVMKSLDLGAFDFIPKTSGTVSFDIDKQASILIEKIKAAAKVEMLRKPTKNIPGASIPHFRPITDNWVVAIGASTGGPKAIPEVISRLPRDFPAGILIVQHMPEGFTASFAERLNWHTSLEVREAKEGDEVAKGLVLVAPGGYHMELKGNMIHLLDTDPVNYVKPSVDILMSSVAKYYGQFSIGVILTGMGADGTKGLKAIKRAGGFTIAQDEKTCVVFGMPGSAIYSKVIDKVCPLNSIALEMMGKLEGRS